MWAANTPAPDPANEPRFALVIGNSDYADAPLRNPVNDATDIADVLKQMGFEVVLLTNADRTDMRKAIRDFGDKLDKGGVGLFFFAGHGMQVDGVNYLIPVKADIAREDEVADEAIDANAVLRKMESAGNRMNMVFLDACRNNPFARSFRSGTKGLAQMDAPKGSLIAYATAPGSTASDGDGRNGVFTENLLKKIRTPGLEVGQLMRQVRAGVMETTDDMQVPWDSSSLTGNFYFVGGPDTQFQQVASSGKFDAEEEFWEAIKNSTAVSDMEAYLTLYPNGRFAPIARLKINQMQRGGAPAPKQEVAQRDSSPKAEEGDSSWTDHLWPLATIMIGYSGANSQLTQYNALVTQNQDLVDQYNASLSSVHKTSLANQYNTNQATMKKLESKITRDNILTGIGLAWETWVLIDAMIGSAQAQSPAARNFYFAAGHAPGEVNLRWQWRF